MGTTEKIAMGHYLQTTEDIFDVPQRWVRIKMGQLLKPPGEGSAVQKAKPHLRV